MATAKSRAKPRAEWDSDALRVGDGKKETDQRNSFPTGFYFTALPPKNKTRAVKKTYLIGCHLVAMATNFFTADCRHVNRCELAGST